MASKGRISTNPTYYFVLIVWIISVLTGDTLGQEVTFRPQDEVNDVIIFEQEENIKLVCDVRGLSDEAVIEIRHESFGLISGQGSASISGNFTVEAVGKSTILTIKKISDLTNGQYNCTIVVPNAGSVSALYDLVMTPRFRSPQCYSSTIAEGGSYLTEGVAFYADCFYEDVGEAIAKWVKIGDNGVESDLNSDEITLDAKLRRRFVIPAISQADDGITYKCILDRMIGAITVPTANCAIGPLRVRAVASAVGRQTTSVSSTTSPMEGQSTSVSPRISVTAGQDGATSRPTKSPTDKLPTDGGVNEPFSLEENLLYILIGVVAVSVILFILLGICICCCSRRSGGKTPRDSERGKPLGPEVNGNPIPDYDQMPFDSKHRNGSLYYDKPPPTTGTHNPGYVNLKDAEPRSSIIIPGPEDMVSTHL